MTPARRSPSTRTLGSQLVEISTVLALIARIFLTASRPMPVIARRRNATTVVILARMENLANMIEISRFGRWQVTEPRISRTGHEDIKACTSCVCVNLMPRKTTEETADTTPPDEGGVGFSAFGWRASEKNPGPPKLPDFGVSGIAGRTG